jgi:deazaflavin-dependent oxidoreductase (nitroreductase family)
VERSSNPLPSYASTVWGSILAVVGVLLLVLVVLGAVFLIGMRTKSPVVLRTVRRMNRRFINPRQMKSAGTPGAYAAIVRHVGRTSGRAYETPVAVFVTDDGFVIALPYGSDPDWLKNVVAAGSAELVHEGGTYRVERPELVPTGTIVRWLPENEVRNLRRFAVAQCLRLRTVRSVGEPAAGEPV